MCIAVALALVAGGLVAAGLWRGVQATPPVPAPDPVVLDHPGAMALRQGYVDRSAPGTTATPPIDPARGAWVDYARNCVTPRAGSPMRRCRWIDPATPDSPTVVVVGDSHMQQLLPAVEPVARANGWAVDAIIKGACPFSVTSETVPGSVDCTEWNRAAIDEIVASRPSLVVASASRNVRIGLTESTPPGFVAAWTILAARGIPVLAVRDNPRFSYSPTTCVAARGRHAPACDVPRNTVYGPTPPISSTALPQNVHYLDTADLLCGPSSCSPEVGNVMVYLDDNHMSASYAATMAPAVGPHLVDAIRR